MIWPWRMPRNWPWATPYPLPRDTRPRRMLAEGQCENFGLLLRRYLAFGSNRGQVQLVRELADRSALVPDFTKQKELVDAYSARWRNLAEEMGAITFSARPQWHVIMGLGTNDILEGGIVLRVHIWVPDPSRDFSQRREPRLRPVGCGCRAARQLDVLLGMVDEDESRCGDLVSSKDLRHAQCSRNVGQPDLRSAYYRDCGRRRRGVLLSPSQSSSWR